MINYSKNIVQITWYQIRQCISLFNFTSLIVSGWKVVNCSLTPDSSYDAKHPHMSAYSQHNSQQFTRNSIPSSTCVNNSSMTQNNLFPEIPIYLPQAALIANRIPTSLLHNPKTLLNQLRQFYFHIIMPDI